MTYNLFYYIGRRALADVIKQGEEVMDTREGQSSFAPATAEDVFRGCILAVDTCKGLPMLRE